VLEAAQVRGGVFVASRKSWSSVAASLRCGRVAFDELSCCMQRPNLISSAVSLLRARLSHQARSSHTLSLGGRALRLCEHGGREALAALAEHRECPPATGALGGAHEHARARELTLEELRDARGHGT